MSEMLDKLLALELPEPEVKRVKLKRLSALAGTDVVFTLTELPYRRIEGLLGEKHDTDELFILEGVTDPNLRDEAWFRDKMGCVTPVDAIKKLLRPGEVRGLVRKLDELAGFGVATLEDVVKK